MSIALGEASGGGSPLLRVRNLAKRFGRHVVLDGVDITVHAGELVALVGENAAGKTTLVHCIAGILPADEGTVDIVGGAPGVVWQDLGLCENLDATANLFLGREPRGFWMSEAVLDQRAGELLRSLGIEIGDLHRPVSTLSGGQRQMLAIARALADGPRLLILDEPTASLGVLETRSIERLLLDLRAAGCGLLLVSHRIEQVFGIADRVVVMRHGRVAADRPTVELHPDDVVSLMAGLEAESTARRQMERLRSLVDQLAEVEPSASIPLIVSALSTAVGADQVCVHLRVPPQGSEPPVLRRRAAVGVRAPLLDCNGELPIGPDGGMVGLAAAHGRVIVSDDVRRDAAWAVHRRAGLAAGVLSAWAMPIQGVDGVLGVISVYADAIGRPQPTVLELATMYTSLAVSVIERERLLGEVTRRNQILESLRGMLDTLTGPMPDDTGIAPALSALCRGLRAAAVVICSVDAAPAASTDGPLVQVRVATDRVGGKPHQVAEEECMAAAGRLVAGSRVTGRTLAVPLAANDGRFVLAAWWPATELVGDDSLDLLHDAARSLSLALEREEMAAARVEATALRRSQRVQREFLSRLSHELRTPLTAIHGYASTLRQPDVAWDKESEDRFLGVIEGESARMGRLVADLLDSSAIEAGVLRLDPHWCDLELAIEAAVSCVAGAQEVVDVHVDAAVRRVWADHDRLEQVLVNLVDNALRHGRPGGPVRVEAVPAAQQGNVSITVSDTGAGFPAEVRERAFEPYTRGGAAAPGAGLGLAVCRGIVEAHGGSIAVVDREGGGCVEVTLPVEPLEPGAADEGMVEHAGL